MKYFLTISFLVACQATFCSSSNLDAQPVVVWGEEPQQPEIVTTVNPLSHSSSTESETIVVVWGTKEWEEIEFLEVDPLLYAAVAAMWESPK